MKKIRKICLWLLVILPVAFSLASCEIVTSEKPKSAYDIAVDNGFKGTEKEWLDSLKGKDGSLNIEEIYNSAKANGYTKDFLTFLKEYFQDTDINGKSAYEVACENGFEGTEEEWLQSLKGESGADGKPGDRVDLYEVYTKLKQNGEIDCTYLEFVKKYINASTSNEQVISKSMLSAVTVMGTTAPITNWDQTTSGSTGAGVIFRINKSAGDAYIITNFHVVYNSDSKAKTIFDQIYVFIYGQQYSDSAIEAKYIGGSSTYDIAVLKVENSSIIKESDCQAVSLYDSNEITVGSTAIAIGTPEANGLSVTEGIVSVDSETIDMSDIKDPAKKNEMRVIRIDTPVNSGNSGGGLFNSDGKLIGIVNAKIKSSDVENIGYAIPSNVAVNVANNIIANNGKVLKCLIGVTITPSTSKAVYDENTGKIKVVEEIVVYSVSEDGIASGKLQKDDIIKSATINGITYNATRNFVIVDACLTARKGDTLTLNIIRNEQAMTITLTFGEGILVE